MWSNISAESRVLPCAWEIVKYVIVCILLFLALVLVFALIPFARFHFNLVARNSTTIENMDPQNKGYASKYDGGFGDNWMQVSESADGWVDGWTGGWVDGSFGCTLASRCIHVLGASVCLRVGPLVRMCECDAPNIYSARSAWPIHFFPQMPFIRFIVHSFVRSLATTDRTYRFVVAFC
eukprot:GHVU01070477.1.p1 GENE.GHVU01070477.1~~GHVU01070477.1.p1  ORF type:complete len:179 (-),score=6.99 GHVU01070477.1:182-718(-)